MSAAEHPEASPLVHSVVEDAQIAIGAMPYARAEEALDVFFRFVDRVPAGSSRAEQVLLDDLVGRIARGVAERFLEDTHLSQLRARLVIAQLRDLHIAIAWGGTTHWRMRRFFVYLHAHYSRPGLTARETAKALNISVWHLSRVLHEYTGRSFRDHLRGIRIRAAKELLVTSTLSIKEVAGAVGYATVSVLDHDFRRECGESPTVFRRLTTPSRMNLDASTQH